MSDWKAPLGTIKRAAPRFRRLRPGLLCSEGGGNGCKATTYCGHFPGAPMWRPFLFVKASSCKRDMPNRGRS